LSETIINELGLGLTLIPGIGDIVGKLMAYCGGVDAISMKQIALLK